MVFYFVIVFLIIISLGGIDTGNKPDFNISLCPLSPVTKAAKPLRAVPPVQSM
jgi:hypothetical protein